MAKTERKFGRLELITVLAATLIVMLLTYLLVAHTPLRRTIPGYPDQETRKTAVENLRKIDSLEKVINLWAFQVANIQRVATGREALPLDSMVLKKAPGTIDDERLGAFEAADSLLRIQMEQLEAQMQEQSAKQSMIAELDGLKFTTPLKATIRTPFSNHGSNTAIELTAPAGTAVAAVLDGRILSSEWSETEGCTIRIQHDHELCSIVRYAGKILKTPGEQVKAGTAVAAVGQTSELSDSHILFELRYRNQPVDPATYIKF